MVFRSNRYINVVRLLYRTTYAIKIQRWWRFLKLKKILEKKYNKEIILR